MEKPLKRFFSSELFRKNLPFIFLLLLTILLMMFLRYNKRNISKIIEEGKRNLLTLYTSGLRPLISQTEVSEEDLFNFAFYQSLPLDKQKNKVLILSHEQGRQVYEIKTTDYNRNTKNYEAFVKVLGMDNRRKLLADSVLGSYKKDIYACVLSNDKDAYAINPRIVKVQQAMLADLMTLAYKVNSKKAEKFFISPDQLKNTEFASLIKSAKQPATNEYFLITPDTVAKTDLFWDQKKFNNELKAYELGKLAASDIARDQSFNWKFESHTNNEMKSNENNIDFKIDPKIAKVTIPMNHINRLINDSLRNVLEEVQRKIREAAVNMPRLKKRIPGTPQDMIPPVAEFGLKISEQTLKAVGDMNIPKIIEEAMKASGEYESMMKDSVKMKKWKAKMREANKRLRKLGMDSLNIAE